MLPHIYGSLNSDRSVIVNSPWLGIHSSLGWITPTLGFLLVAGGIALVRRRPRGPLALAAAVAPLYFWAFDLPPLTWLAGLPYVLRIQPHYLPLIGSVLVCVIVGIGYDYLMRCRPSTTALAGGVWLTLMTIALVAATAWMHTTDVPVASVFSALTDRTAISFVWATITPAVVYWRWGGGAALSGLVALSAVGYFPWAWRAPVDKAPWLALAVGVGMLSLAWVVGRTKDTTRWVTTAAVLAPVALHIVLGTSQNRLPARHLLYDAPAYASFLKAQVGSWRSFGLGGYLFPNYAAVSGINSINAIAAMFPRPAERLFAKYLNPQEKPTRLLGLGQRHPDETVPEPWREVLDYRSMWDHLGVRYFVHRGSDLSEAKAPILRYDVVGGESDFAHTALLPLVNAEGRPRSVEAALDCAAGPVDAVAVRFGTAGTAPAGLVEMQVLASGDTVLARVRRDAARLRPDAFYEFVFPESVCSRGETRLTLRLWYKPRPPVRPLAVWKPDDSPGFGFRPLRLRQVPSTGLSGRVAPIPLTTGLEAPFVCPAAPLHALRVYAGTYLRTNPGTLHVRIGDSSGTERYTTTLDSAHIEDLEGVRTTVPSGICTAGERLQLDVTHQPAGAGSRVALFAEQDQPFKFELYTDSRSGIVRRFDDPQTGATVWENLQAQPRAYLAPEARHAPDWEAALDGFATSADLRRVAWFDDSSRVPCPSASPVPPGASRGTVTHVTVGLNHVDVAVEASMPGTLVLTDAYMPGWSATLDGTAQPVVRVNGVFRGVCIPSGGAHTVRFSSFPPGLLQGGVLAALGVALATTFTRRSTAVSP